MLYKYIIIILSEVIFLRLKWYHIVCIVCIIVLFLLGVLTCVVFLSANIINKGLMVLFSALGLCLILTGIVLLLVHGDKKSVVKAIGPMMVDVEGLLKIEKHKNVNAYLRFCKNGVYIYSDRFDPLVYGYKYVDYIHETNKYVVLFNVADLGKCKFTCTNPLKVKAIKQLINN